MRLLIRNDGWEACGAKVAGPRHARSRAACEDAFALDSVIDAEGAAVLIAAVSDGAGSAAFAAAGAALAVQALTREATTTLTGQALQRFGPDDVRAIFDRAHMHVLSLVASPPEEYSATALLALLGPEGAWVGQIGDGAAVFRDATGEWRLSAPPQRGDYANVTRFLIEEDALAEMIIAEAPGADRVALLSDGLQDSVLQHGGASVHAPFFEFAFDAWSEHEAAHNGARDASRMVEAWLKSAKLRRRSDDDKTLVLCRRRA